jgi:hypothetical protein
LLLSLDALRSSYAIHQSAWNKNSAKFASRISHISAPIAPRIASEGL